MMTAEEFKRLEKEKQKTKREHERRKSLELGIGKAISEEAFRHFPELRYLNTDEFLKFGEMISMSATDVSARIIYLATKK